MLPTNPEAGTDSRQEGLLRRRRRTVLTGSSVAAAHAADWDQRHWTSRVLHNLGELTARSSAGVLAAFVVILWVIVGFVAGFPTWWSTAFYSGTASVTFVMVFVIQHTHERQVAAMQRKLDELIRSSDRADDGLIAVEEASDDHLQALTEVHVATGQQMRE
ncbi:MAG: low affinity iron permease family protein [Ilumatobacteraceae bacterium]